MFERLTERGRLAMSFAHDEARDMHHSFVGTEHILLGLIRERHGLGARCLSDLGVNFFEVKAAVRCIVGRGEGDLPETLPFTPRAKKVCELSLREALSLGHNYVGTEHLLLGLMRETEGVAARILLDFDADAEKIRNQIIRMLSGPGRKARTVKVVVPPEPTEAYRRGWNHGYAAGLREAKP